MCAVCLAAGAFPVLADGVVEINAARAMKGGVTATDLPGYPITIASSGSYRLTSDLDLRGLPDAANLTAIEITHVEVTLDLGGFSIIGPNTGCPSACTASGNGRGIRAPNRAVIENGSVSGMGSEGILSSFLSRFSNLRLSGNGWHGLSLDGGVFGEDSSIVLDVVSTGNAGAGVVASGIPLLRRVTASGNGGNGALLLDGGLVLDSSFLDNADFGLESDPSSSAPIAFGRAVLRRNGGGDALPQIGGVWLEVGINLCGNDTTCP